MNIQIFCVALSGLVSLHTYMYTIAYTVACFGRTVFKTNPPLLLFVRSCWCTQRVTVGSFSRVE